MQLADILRETWSEALQNQISYPVKTLNKGKKW